MRCDFCGHLIVASRPCPSCILYNAAVAAEKAAAESLAKAFDWRAKDAWLNQFGVFAFVNGKTVQVAGPKVAAPFDRLERQMRRLRFPDGVCWHRQPRARAGKEEG